MQGRNHLVFGAMFGLLTASAFDVALGTERPEIKLLASSVAAGAGLLADIDAPRSKAARFLVPVTVLMSWLVVAISKAAVAMTRSEEDVSARAHRTLTHTLLFCSLCTAAWDYASDSTIASIVTIALLACLGASWIGGILVFIVIAMNQPLAQMLHDTAWAWPTMIFVGYFSHLIGDGMTPHGVPIFAPIPIAGQRWGTFHILPERLRFLTGGPFEILALTYILRALLAVEIWFLVVLPARELTA